MTYANDFWKSKIEKWTALDPIDRLSEVLFGLIMVLTFTGTISVSTAGRQDVMELLWAALGCNFAWGLVDGIMNTMDTILGRAHDSSQLLMLKRAKNSLERRSIVRDNLPPLTNELMDDSELDKLAEKMISLPAPKRSAGLTFRDVVVAGQIFLLVFLSTFPVVMPFIFIADVALALRVSNGVALLLMFACGYYLAKYAGMKPLLTALLYTGIGMLLVALTMMLGG